MTRQGLTATAITELWNTLDHPPLSFLGDLYQYRQADGSFNNLHNPSLGKAGSSYARSVEPKTPQPAALPEPQLIFDTLLSRDNGGFKPHPNGISSVFFYLATIVIHDIFRTSREDPNVSLTSSYLDLAPLYGANQKEQDTIRVFKNGKLKPDSFCEKRTYGFPPGVNCLLVFFNRYHNWVVERLEMINERGRFSRPADDLRPDEKDHAFKKLDNDLFQTGRLIWIEHHFHSLFRELEGKSAATNPSQNFAAFEKSIPDEPERRTFGGLTRSPDGRYTDSDLARIWTESVEDIAGA
ncbi:hypothetical protein ACHAQH_002768 [Verticillium albo-atrum]